MTVTLRLYGVCPVCGYRNQGIDNVQVRVNKHTLVKTGPSLFGIPRECGECTHPLDWGLFTGLALDPQDEARVKAYRQRKGWTV